MQDNQSSNSDRLVTIAHFSNPFAAAAAKEHLEVEGIRSITDGEAVTSWLNYYGPGVAQVALCVFARDKQQALAALERLQVDSDPNEPTVASDDTADRHDEGHHDKELDDGDDDEAEQLSRREYLADRGLRCAILGLVVLPFQLLALWQILRAAFEEGRLAPNYRRKAILGFLISTLWMTLIWWTISMMGRGR